MVENIHELENECEELIRKADKLLLITNKTPKAPSSRSSTKERTDIIRKSVKSSSRGSRTRRSSSSSSFLEKVPAAEAELKEKEIEQQFLNEQQVIEIEEI